MTPRDQEILRALDDLEDRVRAEIRAIRKLVIEDFEDGQQLLTLSGISGCRLRDLRRQEGVTLDGLSEITGLSASFISRMELGKRSAKLEHLIKISDALGVSLAELRDEDAPDGDLTARIVAARKAAKLTQTELAEAVGVTRGAVAQWESGETAPRRKLMARIAETTSVSLIWLECGVSSAETMQNPSSTIGGRIRSARKAWGMPQIDLAEGLGVSAQAVTQWEKNQTLPSASRFSGLADLLGVSVEWILSGRGETSEPAA